MGEKLTKLTIGSVGRDVQNLTAGDNITISASGEISAEIDTTNYYTKTETDALLDDYYTSTEVDTELADKVDKVTGKGLSTNDYTNADKAIVSAVTADLNGKVDKVTGKGLSTNDYTNADKAIVDGVTTALAGKQNTLTAGANIQISGNTISATDTKYTAGANITISSANVISATGGGGGATYTAGDNIQISSSNVISATDTKYTAGTGLSLSGTAFSVKTGYTTSGNNRAVQADANGNLYVVQKDDDTQYTAGTNVQISASNVISATDTKYTAGDKIAISSANVISLNLTKADILTILGYKETTLVMTDTDGTATTKTILIKE